ncbi:hypothetical protein [Pseudonocardia sp. TMWB2A]|uniref:hypothetical protein n=1 Tax=Pseudonocardia sp. TMWB2A TaxID=687430 RepID=UPI00307E8065
MMGDAEEYLSQFNITDGEINAIIVEPHQILIDGQFVSCDADGNWTGIFVRISLKDPAGVDMAIQYPGDCGLIYAKEFGDIREIEASGPREAASFFVSSNYAAVRVKRCILSIKELDDDRMEKLYPWLFTDEPANAVAGTV